VRAYNGKSSRWYCAAARQKAGRIIAAGMTKDVISMPVEGSINNRHQRRVPREIPPQPVPALDD
jgi:hypothetical protein